MKIETRKCAECGVRFVAKRHDQKFHSAECRKLWWKRAQRGSQVYDILIGLSGKILKDYPALAEAIINWRKEDRRGKETKR